jgi:hypothetical protein
MSSDFDEEPCGCGQCNGVGEVDDYEYDGYDEDPELDRIAGLNMYPTENEYGEIVWIGEEEYRKLQLTKSAACLYGVMVVTWLLALYLEGDAA